MRLGEEIRRRVIKDIGAFHVERELYVHAGFIFYVFQGLRACWWPVPQAEVVTDLVQLADDSFEYRWPTPTESMISRAAMEISAVSIPYGQYTEQRRHCEH